MQYSSPGNRNKGRFILIYSANMGKKKERKQDCFLFQCWHIQVPTICWKDHMEGTYEQAIIPILFPSCEERPWSNQRS